MPDFLNISALGSVLRLPLAGLSAKVTAPQGDSVDDAQVAAAVRGAWCDAESRPDAATDGASPAEVVVPAARSLDRLLEALSSDVTQSALLLGAGRLLMLHAGGIALDDGRVIAFVAPSGHGKTTLARTLGSAYGYVSDETIAFDEQLQVYPYRKPLSVVTPGHPKQQLAPRDVGLQPLPAAPLKLAAIVLLDRVGAQSQLPQDQSCSATSPSDASVAAPVLQRLAMGDALAPLVAQTSYLSHLDLPLQRLASALAATGGVITLRYDSAESVLTDMPRLVSELTALGGREPWHGVERALLGGEQVIDAIELGTGEAVVFVGDTLHTLSPVATEVWRCAARGASLQETCERVVQRFGAPPAEAQINVTDHITEMLAELKHIGVL